MIPKFIKKFIGDKLLEGIESLTKKHKLHKLNKLIKYVEQPNELDEAVKELQKNSHPPAFTTEEKTLIMARLNSQSDRIIALEKKTKKFK